MDALRRAQRGWIENQAAVEPTCRGGGGQENPIILLSPPLVLFH